MVLIGIFRTGGPVMLMLVIFVASWSPVQAQFTLLGLPGSVLNSQIEAQSRMWRKTEPKAYRESSRFGREAEIIYTDRQKRPISQQEFMREVQRHYADVYLHTYPETRDVEEITPQDEASFY